MLSRVVSIFKSLELEVRVTDIEIVRSKFVLHHHHHHHLPRIQKRSRACVLMCIVPTSDREEFNSVGDSDK